MTAQIANHLINECPDVDFSHLHLYALLIGDVRAEESTISYSFTQQPDESKINVLSACWSGYTSTYKLTKNKELALIGFKYPAFTPENIEPDKTYELLTGDFWLMMRPNFFEDSIYIPFKNGKLITDQSEWCFSKKESTLLSRVQDFLKQVFGE